MLLRSWLIAGSLAAASVVAAGCGSPEERAPIERAALDDWRIKPGVRVGSMNRASSELDLAQAYGYANVRDSIITLGEGERARGTLVFPTDPQRRLEIIWGDPALKREPQRVVLRGARCFRAEAAQSTGQRRTARLCGQSRFFQRVFSQARGAQKGRA